MSDKNVYDYINEKLELTLETLTEEVQRGTNELALEMITPEVTYYTVPDFKLSNLELITDKVTETISGSNSTKQVKFDVDFNGYIVLQYSNTMYSNPGFSDMFTVYISNVNVLNAPVRYNLNTHTFPVKRGDSVIWSIRTMQNTKNKFDYMRAYKIPLGLTVPEVDTQTASAIANVIASKFTNTTTEVVIPEIDFNNMTTIVNAQNMSNNSTDKNWYYDIDLSNNQTATEYKNFQMFVSMAPKALNATNVNAGTVYQTKNTYYRYYFKRPSDTNWTASDLLPIRTNTNSFSIDNCSSDFQYKFIIRDYGSAYWSPTGYTITINLRKYKTISVPTLSVNVGE